MCYEVGDVGNKAALHKTPSQEPFPQFEESPLYSSAVDGTNYPGSWEGKLGGLPAPPLEATEKGGRVH